MEELRRETEPTSYGSLMAGLVRIGYRKVGESPKEDIEYWFNATGRGEYRWAALFSVRRLTGVPGWAIMPFRHDPRPG